MKKILIHSNYHPNNAGGIESVVSKLIELMISLDYSVTCFFGRNKNDYLDNCSSKVTLTSRKIVKKISGAPLLSWGNLFFIKSAKGSDLIIFQEPFPFLWPAIIFIIRVLRIPVIVVVHATPIASSLVMRIYAKLRCFIFRGAIFVTTSPKLKDQIDSVCPVNTRVIPLCVSDSIQVGDLDSIQIPGRYCLYFGRIASYKGIEYLLEAARLVPQINIVIAGDGPLASLVSQFIVDYKLSNVQFFNKTTTEAEKYSLIKGCDFLVFPSTSENEAFGIVQLEAMRLGKAIVNTWLESGVNYVAPHRVNALSVDRCNAIQLSAAMQELWMDTDLINELGKNSEARYFEFFSEDRFKNNWQFLLEEVLNGE
jgi:glycosyltransferase involved in cell wall biosynthesis